MLFKNEIKPKQILSPILFGIIAFTASIVFFNYSLKWHEKKTLILYDQKTVYRPAVDSLISQNNKFNVSDTLFTPFTHDHAKEEYLADSFIFNRYPLLLIWIMAISFFIGFGFSFIPIYFYKINENGFKWYYLVVALFIIVLVYPPQLIGSCLENLHMLLPRDIQSIFGIGFLKSSVRLITWVPFIPIIFWIITIISLLQASFENRFNITKLKLFKRDFETFNFIIAISLGLSIFCNNIFNTAMNQILQTGEGFKFLPNEFAFVNAIIYSFVLVISYVFIGGYLNSLIINNATDPINNKLDNKSFTQYLGIILSMMSPILGGWVAEIIEILK